LNYFDLLLLANTIVASVALYQLRIATFIFAGNNILVARSLGAILRYGPPSSQYFIPTYVFSSENLSTAGGIVTIPSVALVILTVFSARRHVRIGVDAPSIPKPLLVAIGIYFVFYFGGSDTILSTSYSGVVEQDNVFELAGGYAFICSLVLYDLARRRLLNAVSAHRAFLVMFVVFFFNNYLKGSTGITTGYLLTSAIMLLPHAGSGRRIGNVFRISTILATILALSLFFRFARILIHEDGWKSVGDALGSAIYAEESLGDNSEGVESIANGTQAATHILMCVSLWDSGISRSWRSIYNVVEYTLVPSFLQSSFGWERSISSPIEMMLYFPNLGGTCVLGEFYWNGGWLCVFVMSIVLAFFCFVVDRFYRASPFWLMMMAQFAPSFLMGYGYGFSQVVRGAINCLLAAGVYWAYKVLQGYRARLEDTPGPEKDTLGPGKVEKGMRTLSRSGYSTSAHK
jgi:hypothetical protein